MFNVSIHIRHHSPDDSAPADRSRVDCPLPEGRGYQDGMPGIAGRQAISLKGEVSDHKGRVGEILRFSHHRFGKKKFYI
jgi:hypothetical protein